MNNVCFERSFNQYTEFCKVKRITYNFEDALDLTGNGRYNYWLAVACFVIVAAMGIDVFGLGIIVTASTCDLHLSLFRIGIISSMPFAGIIVMCYPWGFLSDTKGRKVVLLWSMSCAFISAALSSLSPNWHVLAALRFLSSASSCAAESVTYALLGECCTSKTRARYMLVITSALMLTPFIYNISAYLIMKLEFSVHFLSFNLRPWRLLTFILSLPLGVSAIILRFFSESPKFLASVGRNNDAVQVLKRIYLANGGQDEYPVKEIYLEDQPEVVSTGFSISSLVIQITPLFKPPLLRNTLLLFYLTFVVYITNNSFVMILPTIFNEFFTSYAHGGGARASFCHLLASRHQNVTIDLHLHIYNNACKGSLVDNTIWAGCLHGGLFFLLNLLLILCAERRKVITVVVLLVSGGAAVGISASGQALVSLVLFYVFLTTAMIMGIISSYFVELYPTSHRGMVACLGLLVARVSAFAGTNLVGAAITTHCTTTFYAGAGVVLSGVVAAIFLPRDKLHR